MRVAVIPTIRAFPWGAPGHCMGALVQALLEAGHEVLWFVAPVDRSNPEVARLASAGAKVAPLPDGDFPTFVRFGALRRAVWGASRGGQSLSSQVRRFGPDHIFLNQGGTWCGLREEFFDLLEEYAGRYSLICHLNQPAAPFEKSLLDRARILMRNGRRVFFNSAWTKHLAELQIAESIANAAYFQYPVRFNFEAPLEWPENPIPRLAMVNRLDSHQKGIDVALEAVSRLKAAGSQVQLSIVGSGPEREYLGDLARFLGVSERVTFVGYSDDLKALWERHEMLILPSRYEGLGVVMIEAMGFGRPVLRTPHGGAEEWIVDGETGFLCPGAEVDLLVVTLERALAARQHWKRMGLRAHESVLNRLESKPARTFLLALNLESRADSRPAQGAPRR